jgi:pimeloyl-ACP methyl ester carboxylesterase
LYRSYCSLNRFKQKTVAVRMAPVRRHYLAIFVLIAIYLSAVGSATVIDRDFGNLNVKAVSIPDRDHQLSGLLYRPTAASAETLLPAVVLVHGLSGFKQMMSGIALELARHGFVSLAVDLVGHGNSEGVFGLAGNLDPTLGIMSSVRYLESQPFVKASSVALVGHSLGAGAVRATAAAHRNIAASVFIAGGFGGMAIGPSYGILNSTIDRSTDALVKPTLTASTPATLEFRLRSALR